MGVLLAKIEKIFGGYFDGIQRLDQVLMDSLIAPFFNGLQHIQDGLVSLLDSIDWLSVNY